MSFGSHQQQEAVRRPYIHQGLFRGGIDAWAILKCFAYGLLCQPFCQVWEGPITKSGSNAVKFQVQCFVTV